jgi:hypothetical protein
MATQKQISFTTLECKALWLIADAGYHDRRFPELDADPLLDAAAAAALDKVWRAEKGMGRRPTPPRTTTRGPEIDLTGKNGRAA